MTSSPTTVIDRRGAPGARPAGRRPPPVAGLLPFLLFSVLFLALPLAFLVLGSLQAQDGSYGLQNYVELVGGETVRAYRNSIEISLVTALAGGLFGFLLAWSVILGGLPRGLRNALMTFSGVASNFAGVPLALAFIFTLGQVGLITGWLKGIFGFDPYQAGFSLYTKLGLELVYLYFQFPLMVLIIAPALDGLKKDWREAAEGMGASSRQYWRLVALPILTPSILGTIILLFGNALGAQATAYQLTSGQIPLVTVIIGAQISGDVLHNEGLGYALAMGLVAIMGASIAVYVALQRRTERWLR